VAGARTLPREAVCYRELNDSGPSGCEDGPCPPGWTNSSAGLSEVGSALFAQPGLVGMDGHAQPSRLIAGNLCWAV